MDPVMLGAEFTVMPVSQRGKAVEPVAAVAVAQFCRVVLLAVARGTKAENERLRVSPGWSSWPNVNVGCEAVPEALTTTFAPAIVATGEPETKASPAGSGSVKAKSVVGAVPEFVMEK